MKLRQNMLCDSLPYEYYGDGTYMSILMCLWRRRDLVPFSEVEVELELPGCVQGRLNNEDFKKHIRNVPYLTLTEEGVQYLQQELHRDDRGVLKGVLQEMSEKGAIVQTTNVQQQTQQQTQSRSPNVLQRFMRWIFQKLTGL